MDGALRIEKISNKSDKVTHKRRVHFETSGIGIIHIRINQEVPVIVGCIMVIVLMESLPLQPAHFEQKFKDVKSMNTTNPYQNMHLDMGGTPRLKYEVPKVKHTCLSSFAEAPIKPLAVASHQRDCCYTTHYRLATCVLVN